METLPAALPPEAAVPGPGHIYPPGGSGGADTPPGEQPGPGSSQPCPGKHPGHLQGPSGLPYPGWGGEGGDGGGLGGHLHGQGQGLVVPKTVGAMGGRFAVR